MRSADPDRSNPTRHRLERPLDTIRSFNAAAEGTSSRRSSFNNRPCESLNNCFGIGTDIARLPGGLEWRDKSQSKLLFK